MSEGNDPYGGLNIKDATARAFYRGGAGMGARSAGAGPEKPWVDGPEKLTLQRDIAALTNVVAGLENDLTGLVKRLELVMATTINLDEAPSVASAKRSEAGHLMQMMVCRLEKCRAVVAQIMDSVEL